MLATSTSAALNSAERYIGGGAGLNCDPDVRKYGCALPNVAPDGGLLTGTQNCGPKGAEPVHGAVKRSALSRSTITSPAAVPIINPRSNCGCTWPGPALPLAATCCAIVTDALPNRKPRTRAEAPATAPRCASSILRPPSPNPWSLSRSSVCAFSTALKALYWATLSAAYTRPAANGL